MLFKIFIKFDKYGICSVSTVLYSLLQPYINSFNFKLTKITLIYPVKDQF